ncbi:MAG: DUF362 domain-containing protein [Pirellulales bacterium]|nr:DUF362 domain-containing protein [Pirellulales bacterium]
MSEIKHTRRDFIARSTAAGMIALGAESLFAPSAQAAEKNADMAIAKWVDQRIPGGAELKPIAVELTEKAIEGIGGLNRFVTQGDIVWVKPNIGWDRTPELAANTNPDVVATLVRLCYEAGAKKVKVGDNPCDLAKKTYDSSGIAAAAESAGAEVVFLDRNRFRDMAIGGKRVKNIPIYPEILECDLVINVPIVKHHGLTNATMCMKNYMGVIENRRTFHQAIADCLVDLTRFMKPQVCVLDGIRILKNHGPKGGNSDDVELKATVAAGIDIVALDAWGAELMGLKPDGVQSTVQGDALGLGTMNYRALNLNEIGVS